MKLYLKNTPLFTAKLGELVKGPHGRIFQVEKDEQNNLYVDLMDNYSGKSEEFIIQHLTLLNKKKIQ